MHIEELMTTPVVTCFAQDTLNIAAQKMWDNDCGVLPVVTDDGRLVGILTDRDICMSAWTRGRLLNELRAEDAMSKQVFSVTPDQGVSEAEKLMSDKQVRRIPVVDASGKPIGVLSMNDLAREAAKRDGKLKDGLLRAAHTLASICQPRKRDQKAA